MIGNKRDVFLKNFPDFDLVLTLIQHHELGQEGTIKYTGKNRPYFFEDGKLGGSYQFTDLQDNFIKVDFNEDQIELIESST